VTLGATYKDAFESRWEAAPAVALVIALQVTLALVSNANDWPLGGLPWWVWLIPVIPEVALLAPLAFSAPRRSLQHGGHRRSVELGLLGVVVAANGFLLGGLLASLIEGDEKSGGELLFKAGTVWATNVVVFGLIFWAFDRGGPARRAGSQPPLPDFGFPQMDEPRLAGPDWHPRLMDYIYVSFTNALAFSPTDTMPLTHRAKLLMVCEATVSALTLLLVASRAVNIFR
jgi:hypothetical protein